METEIISIASVFIAAVAVCIATWQVRASAKNAERSNALPVLSEIFSEWRSPEFRMSILYLISETPAASSSEGFASLPEIWREHAYKVCYFLDYLGVLVVRDIIREETIIGMMGTRIIQVWRAIEPHILAERQYRIRTYPSDAPPGFLVYYEHLVACTINLGGHDAAIKIQRRDGVQRLAGPLVQTKDLPGPQADSEHPSA
jgi:hypothetical protein